MAKTKHLFLVARSGAGKREQAVRLLSRLNAVTVVMEMSAVIEKYGPQHLKTMKKGELIKDRDVLDMWVKYLTVILQDNPEVVIHDGALRSPEQAYLMVKYLRSLGKDHEIYVIDLDVPEEICEFRMQNRAKKSGIVRKDDEDPEARKKRLDTFNKNITGVYAAVGRNGISVTLVKCGEKDEEGVFVEILKKVPAVNVMIKPEYQYRGEVINYGKPAEHRDWLHEGPPVRRSTRRLMVVQQPEVAPKDADKLVNLNETLVEADTPPPALSTPVH